MLLHSQYSIHYGIHSPEDLVQWAKENDYPYALLADINSTGAVLAFLRATQKSGIQGICGVQLRNDMTIIATLIARNNRGFHEINQFLSHHLHQNIPFPEKLPHLTNCYIVYPLCSAANYSLRENEYLSCSLDELPGLPLHYPYILYEKLLLLQSMTFLNKRDFNTHRLLRAIHYNVLLSKLPTEGQTRPDELLLSRQILLDRAGNYKNLLANTEKLLQSCRVSFDFGDDAKPQNPSTFTGSIEQDEQLLRELCEQGMNYRYPRFTEQIKDRIEKEISIIAQKNYLSYFLIAWDFTSYARSKGYFYVGRGSGANSLVAYLLRITDVDPLELDLYFERFINLFRKNPPDFDIDFSWKERDDVVRYLFERYPHAAWLCTYNTFQYRATIRELGKVFGLPKTEIDTLCSGKFIESQLDDVSKLVLKYSRNIFGLPSHLSVHSGGIVISEKPMSWFSATFLPPKGYPTTQFSMLEAEDVGLYKFDILSQRGLGKIRECIDIIHENQPENPPHDIHDIAHFKQDKKVEQLLLEAKALGCFYVESPAMRMLMVKLKVRTYLELVAASSIIRPGVSQSGMMREYILRHRFPEKRAEANPHLLAIMPETYGVMVYQEDVIKVAHHFAGLTLAEADVLRRGMSGKFRSREEFRQVRDRFFANCQEKGHDEILTSTVWRQIESFAGYAFAKGHSASYAVESYQSLYLKAHYPLEYLTACINNFGGYYRTEIYVHEARKWGAKIEAPSINYGDYPCVLRGERLILGFNLVNGIEGNVIISVMNERDENGPFLHLDDLLRRTALTLEQLSLIIRIGALRDFPEPRKELLWKTHFHFHRHKKKERFPELFYQPVDKFELPNLSEPEQEAAFEQMELLGFPLCNPFDLLEDEAPAGVTAAQLPQLVGQVVAISGYLVSVKRSRTSKGDTMNFGTLLDRFGDTIDTVHFPESARRFPFMGKGIYLLRGVVTEEFGYFCLQVGYMEKLKLMEDIRFGDTPYISGKEQS
jgi:DNA polymerase-3 subunit alpha